MSARVQKLLTLIAVLLLAQWFFGNLYEAVVLAPNWIIDSPKQLQRLREFFVRTAPVAYYIPLTQLAPLMLLVLTRMNHAPALAHDYRHAARFGVCALAINAAIVVFVVRKLFGTGSLARADELNLYCWSWIALNLLRMAVVAATAVYAFEAFRKLDRSTHSAA